MTTKGGIRGLPAQFLLEKARYFTRMKSTIAFEVIFTLLAYGLFLFPNVDKFVDVNAIGIFMIGNPVPTLLGDAYYSIHLQNSYHGGMIICCTPLLYQWFISHMPQSGVDYSLFDSDDWKEVSIRHVEENQRLRAQIAGSQGSASVQIDLHQLYFSGF